LIFKSLDLTQDLEENKQSNSLVIIQGKIPKILSGYQHNIDKLTDPNKYIADENNEKRYKETGNESEISLKAGKDIEYTEFFKEFCPNPVPKEKRKHHYTVSLHPAVFMREACDLYKKFDIHTFGQDASSDSYDRFLCNSCLFDPREVRKTYTDPMRIDGDKEFWAVHVYPEYCGTYHFHHRIDGYLFAVTVCDITPTYLLSSFCFYDPAYKFLSPGQFTAMREVEYMMRVREKYNKNMQYYSMKDLVVGCQKTEYKEHMHPTMLKWPESLDWVLFNNQLKERIRSKAYRFLDDKSKPFHKLSKGDVLEWLPQQSIRTKKGSSSFLCFINTVMDAVQEIYQEIGEEFNEMLIFEYKR